MCRKHPNLRAIVVAIASKSGGCNPAEAEKVAKQFRGWLVVNLLLLIHVVKTLLLLEFR